MSLAAFEAVRSEHPLDVVERLVARADLAFDRIDDELAIARPGRFADYQLSFTWLEEVEALHVSCAFDLKVPALRRAAILELVALVNEQLWVGHFDLWAHENVVMYRHALVLAGGAEPSAAQCDSLMDCAVDACERYFQAFQFTLWAGKSAKEALEGAMFETRGEA